MCTILKLGQESHCIDKNNESGAWYWDWHMVWTLINICWVNEPEGKEESSEDKLPPLYDFANTKHTWNHKCFQLKMIPYSIYKFSFIDICVPLFLSSALSYAQHFIISYLDVLIIC